MAVQTARPLLSALLPPYPMPFWTKNKKKKSESGSGSSLNTSTTHPTTLHVQLPTPASSSTKIRLSLLGTALVDALGGPPEFHKRFTFPFVTSMIPNDNFNLPCGIWTDDTSMTLCLANSISTFKQSPTSEHSGGFSELHQLESYARWHQEGYLSAIGRCFDIGNTISRALDIFAKSEPEDVLERVRSNLSEDSFSGNGSLMRIIPIGLAYWQDVSQAKEYARRSSITTHPSPMCIEACEMWTGAIALIMEHTTQPPKSTYDPDDVPFSKLSLLEYIAAYDYRNDRLRQALTLPFGIPLRPAGRPERESWYFTYHPLLRLIQEMQALSVKDAKFPYFLPSDQQLPSTGYVLDTLVAALYCFFATKTFEEGAIMAVNLGSDADTVGAVYAGLAACWYAGEEGKAEGIFWTKRVREWRKALARRDMVAQVAENLVAWEHTQAQRYI